jgi:hypothetical protein
MQEKRVYAREYVAEPASRIYNLPIDVHKTQRCDGKRLTADGFGYKMKYCKKRLNPGDRCYYKDRCECLNDDKLYCSILCCYPYRCNNCNRRSCKECYIANANDRCSYCIYLSDDCDCINKHDEWCSVYVDIS